MKFDARRAKLLQPQEHIAFDDFPCLRLEATATRRTWTYRYRSPLDGNMRQIKLGNWPAMPLAAAVAEWEVKRNIRDTGEDPAHTRRRARARMAGSDAQHVPGAYTVRRLVADYLTGHVEHNACPAAQTNTRYALGTPIEPILDKLPETVTRKMAFDLLERLRDRPTYANRIKMELGAARDYALDAGRLPEIRQTGGVRLCVAGCAAKAIVATVSVLQTSVY